MWGNDLDLGDVGLSGDVIIMCCQMIDGWGLMCGVFRIFCVNCLIVGGYCTCLIFKKNVDINLDDAGPYMKQYGEEQGFMKQPQQSLISSYFGRDLLLITPSLAILSEDGLKSHPYLGSSAT